MSKSPRKWNLYSQLEASAAADTSDKAQALWRSIKDDLELLQQQVCPHCMGFGHAGKSCPTDFKLAHMRCGLGSYGRVLRRARAKCIRESQAK